MKLKDTKDRVLTLSPVIMEDLLLVTKNGYALRFSSQEVPTQGLKSAGVKGINLKKDDRLASAFTVTSDSFFVLTQRGSLKRMAVDDIPQTSRANRGLLVLRELKAKPHSVFLAGAVLSDTSSDTFNLFTEIPEESAEQQVLEVISKTGQAYQIPVSYTHLTLPTILRV